MLDIKKIRDKNYKRKILVDFLKRDLNPLLEKYNKEEILKLTDNELEELAKEYDNHYTLLLKEVIKKDEEYRNLLKKLEKKRAEKNKVNKELREKYKNKDLNNIEELKEKSKKYNEEINLLEKEVKKIKGEIDNLLLQLPNELEENVILGLDEEDNKEISFNNSNNFVKVIKNNKKLKEELEKKGLKIKEVEKVFHHYNLEINNYIDTEKAATISQTRFYFEFNEIAMLDFALTIHALNLFINEIEKENYNYKLVIPPYLVRKEIEEGATTLDAFEEALYKIENENLYLIPTAEHVLAGYFKDKLLEKEELPFIMIGYSPAFRREAGSHGKDTKGIFRTHQFHKIELYAVTKEKEDKEIMKFFVKLAEKNLESLEIPYRKVIICSGDMDKKAKYQIDLEGWFPGQQKFRELGSYAYLGDWQARRLNIKYLDKGKRKFCSTVYATGVAIQRTICALVENHFDEKNNEIKIPSHLKKYLPIKNLKIKQF